MTALRRAIDDYLALRRRLGVTLHEAERVLVAFAAYAERERAEHVTTDLVLRWATQLAGIAASTVNGRCQIIRRFAQWRQLADPLTEVPPTDLIPGRYRRHPPRFLSGDIEKVRVTPRRERCTDITGSRQTPMRDHPLCVRSPHG